MSDTLPNDIIWPLLGYEDAEKSILAALQSGKLHHAWILKGPSGIGKTLLAHRLAAKLLGASNHLEEQPFDFLASNPIAQSIKSASHPDFRFIEAEQSNTNKSVDFIKADAIKSLTNFFSLRASNGYRVGIVNALDHLNIYGANALLKLVEEPPKNAILILISHEQRPILPTIKSRCRILTLSPLTHEDTMTVLQHNGIDDVYKNLVDLLPGRPGQILKIHSEQAHTLNLSICTELDKWNQIRGQVRGKINWGSFIRHAEDEEGFSVVILTLLSWLKTQSITAKNFELTAQWVMIWQICSRQMSEANMLAMDRKQTLGHICRTLEENMPIN